MGSLTGSKGACTCQVAHRASGQANRHSPAACSGAHVRLSACCASSQQSSVLQSVQQTLADGAARIQRGFQAPPPGYPPGPGGEIVPQFMQDPLQFLCSMRAQYGGLVTFVMGGERVVLASDPAAVRQIVQDDGTNWAKEGTAFFPGSSLAGNGLLVAKYAASMNECTQQMFDEVWTPNEDSVRDVYADLNQLTFAVAVTALFGKDVATSAQGKALTESIRVAFEYFAERSANGFIVPEWLPTPGNRAYLESVETLDSYVYDLIKTRRAELAASSTAAPDRANSESFLGSQDLLTALMSAKDEDGSAMADENVRDELMTLLVAGQETSAILLGWTVAFLAWHPDVQQAAADEVQEVLNGAVPSAADLDRLPYCIDVLLEVMRARPPAYMIGRCASCDTDVGVRKRPPRTGLDTYHIQKGTTALVAPYLMHTSAAHWGSDVDQFKPQRWQCLREQGVIGAGWRKALADQGPRQAYLPFGGGPRNCIGTGFAMLEAILVLAKMLQDWHFELPMSSAPFPQSAPLITLRPTAVDVRIRRRGWPANSEQHFDS